MTIEKLMSINETDLPEASKNIEKSDIAQLIDWLSEKDDKIRYQALRLLLNRSSFCDEVYPYWDKLKDKLKNDNSYQRSIGLMLIAENTKWDAENKFDTTVDDYLKSVNDEKPITVRQCIQSLNKIIPYKNHLLPKISDKLMSLQINEIKETMRKVILLDILNVLIEIRKYQMTDEIQTYIGEALSGDILDKKAKKMIEQSL